MNKKEEQAIELLRGLGYQVKKMTEREAMIDNIMETYDTLSDEGKALLYDHVMMVAFCQKNQAHFERFKLRARMSG